LEDFENRLFVGLLGDEYVEEAAVDNDVMGLLVLIAVASER
jgi:hypothetical protein